jgi:hypothetical protein
VSLRASAHDARRHLRLLLEAGATTWTPHATREMAKDGITIVDVVNVLRGGVVEEPEFENGAWRYRVRTQRILVVCQLEGDDNEVPNEILVITAWRARK